MSALDYWLAWPQRLDPAQFWFFCCASILGALASFVGIFVFLRRARLIEDTPTSRIRSAVQGYVELHGEAAVMPGVPIVAPLTHTPCAWFRFRVDERESDGGKQDNQWHTINRGCSEALFLLRDETGECVVDPDGALVTAAATQVWYGDSPTPAPGSIAPGERRWLSTGTYRYREERIHPGDQLYAIGELRSADGGIDGPTRAETSRALLTAWKRDQAGLLARFDTDRDDRINSAEWEAAREAAAQEADTEVGRRLREPGVLMLARPQLGQGPYLLSCDAPHRLTRRYRLYAAGLTGLFLLAGTAALWLVRGASP